MKSNNIVEENVKIDIDNDYVSYTLPNGEVLEVELHLGKINHFGEDVEVLDYIEPIENSYDISEEDVVVEELYDYLTDRIPFK